MIDRDPRRRAPALPSSIETVATATAIIDYLAESEAPAGVQQVADVLGMTKSRASRHLANLEALGLVARRAQGRGYQLGWRTLRWGQIAFSRMPLAKLLDGPLRELNERSGRTVLLCTVAGGDAVVVRSLPAKAAIRIDVDTGLVLSLPHSPTARVCYAFQPRERRRELLEQAHRREEGFRVEDRAAFNDAIAGIQRRYYGWAHDKFSLGHGAVAAPVFDRDEDLAAVITAMLPSEELHDRPPPPLVAELLDAAERCSRLLGSHVRYPRA